MLWSTAVYAQTCDVGGSCTSTGSSFGVSIPHCTSFNHNSLHLYWFNRDVNVLKHRFQCFQCPGRNTVLEFSSAASDSDYRCSNPLDMRHMQSAQVSTMSCSALLASPTDSSTFCNRFTYLLPTNPSTITNAFRLHSPNDATHDLSASLKAQVYNERLTTKLKFRQFTHAELSTALLKRMKKFFHSLENQRKRGSGNLNKT